MARFLAVAHQTSEAPEFVEAISKVSLQHPGAEFVLLVPATPMSHLMTWTEGEADAVASEKAAAARLRLEGAGVTVADVLVGDPNPYAAVLDALMDQDFDEVIVSTLPPGVSRWLGMDLIHRLQRALDVPVTHVIAS